MRLFFLVTILSLITHTSRADEPRYRDSFSSRNKAFTIKLEGKVWNLRNTKGETLYSLKDSGYTSQTILVSDNGEQLIIIDDYINGHNIPDAPVLKFYNNGRLVHSYRFADLVGSYCYCSYSVSHIRWVLFDFSLSTNDSLFNLATYELYEYEFNANGDMVKKQRPPGYNDSAAIVYGKFYRIKGSPKTYELKVKVYVTGERFKDDKLVFKARKLPKDGSRVLMIANGMDITPERYRQTWIIYNACH